MREHFLGCIALLYFNKSCQCFVQMPVVKFQRIFLIYSDAKGISNVIKTRSVFHAEGWLIGRPHETPQCESWEFSGFWSTSVYQRYVVTSMMLEFWRTEATTSADGDLLSVIVQDAVSL